MLYKPMPLRQDIVMKENYSFTIEEELEGIDSSIVNLEDRIELLENDIYVAKLDLGVFALRVAIQEKIYNSTES